jgi:hypothetical protein
MEKAFTSYIGGSIRQAGLNKVGRCYKMLSYTFLALGLMEARD